MISGKRKKKRHFSLRYHLRCRNCPACSKHSSRLKSSALCQADARRVFGWKPSVLLQSISLGITGVIPWSFFISPAKPLRTRNKTRVQAAAFFLGFPPIICVCTLPAHCTNISSSQIGAAQAPLAGPPPSPARLPMEAAPLAPAHTHMFWSPTRLLSCK